jgi:hypothetical protein
MLSYEKILNIHGEELEFFLEGQYWRLFGAFF